MAEYRVGHRVGEVADRLHRLRTLKRQSRWWFAAAVVGLLLLAGNLWLPSPVLSVPLTIAAGAALLVVSWVASRRSAPTLPEAAAAIERRWPSLDSRLLTSIDLRPDEDLGGFNFLQHEVISESLTHAHRHDWRDAVPTTTLSRAKFTQLASLCLFVGAFAAAAWIAHARPAPSSDALLAGAPNGSLAFRVTVEPGDAEIERGTSFLVIARFDGRMPAEVVLHATDTAGSTTSLPLSRSLEDPLFGGRIPRVETDLSYHVTFDGAHSDAYRIEVFDFPRLEQADATIVHPDYTGLGEKTIEDVRRISVVEGSQLTLTCRLNKPVDVAVLEDDDGEELNLTSGGRVRSEVDGPVLRDTGIRGPGLPDGQTRPPGIGVSLGPLNLTTASGREEVTRSVTLTPHEKRRFKLVLIDADGRTNRHPPEFVIDVIPNQPPELAVAFPGRDVRVSPLEEVALEANAQDDFGLTEYGLVYQLPDSDEQSLKLGEEAAGEAKVMLAHQLALEDVKAQPNELVSYYFYADDVGPDGEPRRTFSDMFFAEVRYFDEEYRQAQQSQGQPQSGNMQGNTPSTQLLQLQRDIVNAVWNLIRRERGSVPSAEFPADANTVAESQQEAIAMGQQLQERQEDALAQQYLQEALEHMAAAEESLSASASAPSVEPLRPARKAAYDAYQALVKLHVREHLVQQAQSQSQSQSSGSQSDLNRQLQQLELENDRNRYETEQQDQPPADREQLQVLNRLRELARRQEGLNEKIQELENALRAAQSEEEREEIERQLKRLQEEQQQMLRDLDELNERMNNEQNRSRMTDARQQAQDVRENLRRTSQALKEGQLSRALASGTRAERELNEMKDDLREETAGQFADTMRELRRQARELAEHEQQLGEKLAGGSEEQEPSGPPKLKEDATEDLDGEFKRQRERLDELMDDLKDVIQESELNEPLLSKTLYDTVRDMRSDRPEQSLEMVRQFLRYGLDREAARAEAQARAGIDTLREGVEKAAENVLGNEVDSLRRAQREIDELSRAIGSELAEANPQQAGELPQQTDSPNGRAAASAQDRDEPQVPDAFKTPPEREAGGQPSSPRQDRSGRQPGRPSESGDAPGQRAEPSQQGLQGGQNGEQPSPESSGRSADSSRRNALSSFLQAGDPNGGGGASGPERLARPLTGADYVEWSDRMRDVEEMVDDPDLRARVVQVRERARQLRIEMKRHSQTPNWELVKTGIYGPMRELRDRLAEEIARREPSDDVVPLDRDPVPDRYAELVQQYYERLGSGR